MVDIRESPSGPLVSTGGGGSTEPLSLTFFVDPASTADDPDGSIGAPFLTIQAGLDRLLEEATPGSLLLAPGDYGGETTETELATVGFVGLGPLSNIGQVTMTGGGTLSIDAWVRLSGITVSGGSFTVDETLSSNVIYVDLATTVPSERQNGSAQRPFSTLTAAANAASERGPSTILLPPGTYDDAGEFTFGDSVSLVGVGSTIVEQSGGLFNSVGVSNVQITGDIIFSGNSSISNIFVFGTVDNSANLTIDACQIFAISGGNIYGRGLGPMLADATPRNASRIRTITGANTVNLDSYLINGVSAGELVLSNCWYTNITTGTRLELINSFGFGIPTIITTGLVDLDPPSYGSIRVDGTSVTIDPAQLTVRQNLGWQLTVTVAVPELAAGAVDYVEVASPIAALTLTSDDCVTACPKEDITAPGASAGVYLGVRCTDAGALRFCFMGPIGEVDARDVDFTVAFLS